ncbi:MAG: hybrid sensor histidine kinase/response regulator [Anaerolineales bacterium]|nr:hybrid sensor histidine kinase/response regulator [Anaerolineales bacterium]
MLAWRWLKIARWFIIAASVLVVFAGMLWLESKVFIALIVMPVALAAILSRPFVIAATAVGESVLVLILSQFTFMEADPGSIIIMMAAVWAMVGVAFAIHHPLYDITHWSWINYRKAHDLLEEVRDRKVELQQALDDLAHAYRELDLLNERVTAMRLVAEEAQAAKTIFVAKVSHEFRTPLNMIIGLTDVLMDTPEVYGDTLSPALLEDLKIVHRNCEHLSKMVNDVLDLSQTEIGRLTLRREWTNLAEDIEAALAVVRPLLEKKCLTLQVNIPADLPQIYCDRTRISQVILNLVSNAARFTDQGGITVSAQQQDQHIVVSVADTGPGVSPEDAERIFEPFCQGSGNPWRDQKGSGLGLSISRQFVELHGGQMWLESPPSIPPNGGEGKGGMGSIFSFKLPIAPPTLPSAAAARWINQDWVWHERTSKSKLPQLPYQQRILVYDDTGDLYDLLTNCSDEIEFIKADNLEQAIHEAQTVPAHAVVINTTSNHHPDLLLEQARANLPDTPLIMGAFPSRTKDMLEAGAINQLIKPIMRADLEKAIKAVGKPVSSILIVDDDPEFRQLLRRMLLMDDDTLKVSTASSGEQALAQLRRCAPDLMLIDIAMPHMDGWQTLERKQQDESTKDIPAIIISAQDLTSQPISSQTLSVTMGAGISVDKFLQCSLELSTLLLAPD